MEIYIPWRVRLAAYRVYQQIRCALSQAKWGKKTEPTISFYCNYHQTTGASVAIASIANQLAERYNVDIYIRPQSCYSQLLALRVRQTFSPASLAGSMVFVDIEQENAIVEDLCNNGRKVILTCHALPVQLHAVSQPKLIRNLELASVIHFVSECQQTEFINHYPQLPIAEKSFVIPNYTRQSIKQVFTGNVGIVGYLSRPQKNALRAIDLAQRSNAQHIECWGSTEIAGLDNPRLYSKLRINGWTDKTSVMHASFDVLISTSKFETFGLVVMEALSAGIPCVLSDIPVFRSLYGNCKGVVILSGEDDRDVQSINDLLREAPTLKPAIIDYWQKHFSNESVKAAWFKQVGILSTKTFDNPEVQQAQ